MGRWKQRNHKDIASPPVRDRQSKKRKGSRSESQKRKKRTLSKSSKKRKSGGRNVLRDRSSLSIKSHSKSRERKSNRSHKSSHMSNKRRGSKSRNAHNRSRSFKRDQNDLVLQIQNLIGKPKRSYSTIESRSQT